MIILFIHRVYSSRYICTYIIVNERVRVLFLLIIFVFFPYVLTLNTIDSTIFEKNSISIIER